MDNPQPSPKSIIDMDAVHRLNGSGEIDFIVAAETQFFLRYSRTTEKSVW